MSAERSVAVVTGAGRGIGRGCALALAENGKHVLAAARTSADLASVVAEIADAGGSAEAVVMDATAEDAVERLVAQAGGAGRLEVLVTAAGTNRPGRASTYPLDDWDLLFDLNVRATFLACRAFGSAVLKTGAGAAIITLSSQMGSVGYPGRAAYCATKHAVEGLTRSLAVEWARSGIRVNAVAPTFVETPMTAPFLADPAFREEVLERRLPTGRFATVEEVAAAVCFLASPGAASITGHVLRVDGGWTAW